jgi:DNA repair exonuclease SbcCD nuclease subunit
MRFLHTADWQLGMGRHFLDREHQGQFDAARRDVVGTLGRVAEAEGCEAIVVCGDVFETNQVSARTVRQSMEKLRGLAIPVYLLPGNHDPLNAGSIWTAERFLGARPDNVHVLMDSTPVVVRPGFEIVGAPWTSKQPTSDLIGDACSALEPAPAGVVRIAVGHGGVERFSGKSDLATVHEATLAAALDAGKVHYVALGDRHSATKVTERVWYSGAPEPTAFVEDDPGKVLVVEIDDDEPGSPPIVTPHHVGTWRFHDEPAYLGGPADVAALRARLNALVDKDRTVVKLAVTGTLSVNDKADYDLFRRDLVDVFAAVVDSSSRTDLAVRPEDGDFEALGLTGFAAAALDDLRRQSASDDTDAARVASDALGLLVRLAGSGSRA